MSRVNENQERDENENGCVTETGRRKANFGLVRRLDVETSDERRKGFRDGISRPTNSFHLPIKVL